GLDRLAGRVDLVFADAPCSGSGAWRRNPDARWRFAPADLARLTALQDRIIDRARALVAPGGTIVFATCSCLAAEGPARVLAWARRAGDDAITAAPRFVTLPEPESGDGFFAVKVRAAF
ncbi:MAG: RsmB/NOP family class I SAM-dependent RNA methyltransferase, partial [Pseudomonadota bacterium]